MNPNQYYGWGLPIDISSHGGDIDRLIYVIHIFMALLFVGWFTFLVIALFKFRERPGHKATYKLNHFKTPTYLEVAVALVEVVLLVGFSFPLVHKVRGSLPDPTKSLQIRVVAEQFAWNFHYPGADGIFGKTNAHLINPSNPVGLDPEDPAGKDDITTINQFHIPVNQPVIVRVTSKDVIHSFSIPVMRVKQDVIPGQVIPVWFEAKKTGSFEIACAQLCGLGHYRMRGFFTVDTKEEFKKWLADLAPKPPAPAPTVTSAPTQAVDSATRAAAATPVTTTAAPTGTVTK